MKEILNVSKYTGSKNLNFQNLTVLSSANLEHHLDHFTLGVVFHKKRPLADKTLIQLTNILSHLLADFLS